MKTYPIPEAAAGQYKGSGPALVGLIGGEVARVAYIRDLIPAFSGELADLPEAIDDFRVGGAALKLQKECDLVSICMMSNWEATEL